MGRAWAHFTARVVDFQGLVAGEEPATSWW